MVLGCAHCCVSKELGSEYLQERSAAVHEIDVCNHTVTHGMDTGTRSSLIRGVLFHVLVRSPMFFAFVVLRA